MQLPDLLVQYLQGPLVAIVATCAPFICLVAAAAFESARRTAISEVNLACLASFKVSHLGSMARHPVPNHHILRPFQARYPGLAGV